MERIWALSAWTAFAAFAAAPAAAETFLGEEGEKPTEAKPREIGPVNPGTVAPPVTSVQSQSEEVPSLPDEAEQEPINDEREPPIPRSHAPDSGEDDTHFTFSGAAGAGSGFVSGQATVGYYFTRYVGVETSYFYYRYSADGAAGTQYGPEVDLVARLVNSFMLAPIFGFGPGYTTWHRTYNSSTFSASSSATGNVFYGADLNLTSHFGIEVTRKLETYFGTPPLSFSDRVSHDARNSWSTNIGFRVLF